MMSYGNKEGSFPFTKKELDLLYLILDDKVIELEKDLATVDTHRYIALVQVFAKVAGFLNLMEDKGRVKTEEKFERSNDEL